MEYKLLRALSIFLQAGLVILLIMLLSLLFLSCTYSPTSKMKTKQGTASHQTIMEQRFLNEIRLQRQQYKVLSMARAYSNKQLSPKQHITYASISKKA